MYFDDQVGATIDSSFIHNKGNQLDIIRNTEMNNSNIGIKVYSH